MRARPAQTAGRGEHRVDRRNVGSVLGTGGDPNGDAEGASGGTAAGGVAVLRAGLGGRAARPFAVGVHILDHLVVRALLAEAGEPLFSGTLLLTWRGRLAQGRETKQRLDHEMDIVIGSGDCGTEPTTVIDLSNGELEIVRRERATPRGSTGRHVRGRHACACRPRRWVPGFS